MADGVGQEEEGRREVKRGLLADNERNREGFPTLILKARLNPLAKNPPKGPMSEAKVERATLWIWKGYIRTIF